jgi:Stage II sporulation protein R (spore_II_R).
MKKTILILIFIGLSYFMIGTVIESKELIPEDAIRMRIVPNSNEKYDQEIKTKVKKEIEGEVYSLLKSTKSISDARDRIENNLNYFDSKVNDVLKKENYNLGYKVNFGYNYFPEKKFKGITYKEGYYESLVVTLGKGEGDNWWCVLFPPLCVIEAEENEEVEYKMFINEVLKKYK